MKRTTTVAMLAIGVLAVGGCSSTTSSSGSAASVVSSSAAATSTAATSAAPTSAAAPSSNGSTELDDASVTWFDTLCTGIAPVLELDAAAIENAGTDVAAQQQAAVEALDTLASAYTDTAAALAETDPPGFAGGAAFATAITGGMQAAGGQLAVSANELAALDPTDTSAAAQLQTKLEADLVSATAPLESLGQLPPEVTAAAQNIPSCKVLGGP